MYSVQCFQLSRAWQIFNSTFNIRSPYSAGLFSKRCLTANHHAFHDYLGIPFYASFPTCLSVQPDRVPMARSDPKMGVIIMQRPTVMADTSVCARNGASSHFPLKLNAQFHRFKTRPSLHHLTACPSFAINGLGEIT